MLKKVANFADGELMAVKTGKCVRVLLDDSLLQVVYSVIMCDVDGERALALVEDPAK
jgi:hypothetical protein